MSILGRFTEKVERQPNGCHIWTGGRGTNGYGYFRVTTHELVSAHRWSYAHFVAPIAEGLWVLHRCDNRACVNPEHLFLGTHQDNMDDMHSKGRGFRGKRLTFEDANAIREEYRAGTRQAELAARYGVGQPIISRIVNFRIWQPHGW